jgi:hypothetical protein
MLSITTLALSGDVGAIRLKYVPLFIVGGLLALLVLAVAISALSNLNLPMAPPTGDRLSDVEKARLAEYFHLLKTLGDDVWPGTAGRPGWSGVHVPVITHNDAYAFLVGYPGDPPDGWVMVPGGEHRGGPWETMPDDTFQGEPYYRQPITDRARTPENFTALVGDVWVATLQTKEAGKISFYNGFRSDVPNVLKPIVPYRLLWQLLMGPTENYLGGLAHEAFHAYEGTVAPDRLAAAERVAGREDAYPWKAAEEAWKAELDALHQAARAASEGAPEAEVVDLTRRYLAAREARRSEAGLAESAIAYERHREWLEGLAKYAELVIGREAGRAQDYDAVPALRDDPDFKGYRTRDRFWSAQLSEVKRMTNHRGEIRFYYTGFAQGVILDRLMPDWKTRVMAEDVWLEALLAEALIAEAAAD